MNTATWVMYGLTGVYFTGLLVSIGRAFVRDMRTVRR